MGDVCSKGYHVQESEDVFREKCIGEFKFNQALACKKLLTEFLLPGQTLVQQAESGTFSCQMHAPSQRTLLGDESSSDSDSPMDEQVWLDEFHLRYAVQLQAKYQTQATIRNPDGSPGQPNILATSLSTVVTDIYTSSGTDLETKVEMRKPLFTDKFCQAMGTDFIKQATQQIEKAFTQHLRKALPQIPKIAKP
eukprot:TRINITY_DN60084_c0_g1_i1.p1 TRINITY_DN60084_c0_g1~~TRINITY_DN60084_c0_g1_i1.p1  ORF type:complete len:194 (-),score=49.39 TRINITY_DN60084_c0_g1_i1:471-1052(-)